MRKIPFIVLAILLFASQVLAYTVTLQWTPNPATDGITKYTVYNATTKAVLATVVPPGNSATVSGLSVPTSFYVTATNAVTESGASNVVAITAPMTGIKASVIGTNLVFTWDAVPSATSYAIFTGSTEVVRVAAPALTTTVPVTTTGVPYWLTANGVGVAAMPSALYVVPSPVTDLHISGTLTIGQ